MDLRERVAVVCTVAGQTRELVAARFHVSRSFVEKARRRQRQMGFWTPAGGRVQAGTGLVTW